MYLSLHLIIRYVTNCLVNNIRDTLLYNCNQDTMEDTIDYVTRSKIIESYNMSELAQICKPNKDYYLLYAREKYDKNRCELVNIFNADDIDKMNKIVIPYGWILIESNMKNIIDYITEYGDKNLTYLIYKNIYNSNNIFNDNSKNLNNLKFNKQKMKQKKNYNYT